MDDKKSIFNVLEDDETLVIDLDEQESLEKLFGTQEYFKEIYNGKVESFVRDFLYENLDAIISEGTDNPEVIKENIGNLVDVYFGVRTEFEKHKSKLKVNNRFRSYL